MNGIARRVFAIVVTIEDVHDRERDFGPQNAVIGSPARHIGHSAAA